MTDVAKVNDIREFGDPVLRRPTRQLETIEIKSEKIQNLAVSMTEVLHTKKLGVGLAAPQIGQSIALAVISIRPGKKRPKAKPFDLVIINPIITETYGRRVQLYEGCISGSGSKSAGLFAKVPRYKKIKLKYQNLEGRSCHKVFESLVAHVIQHEVDHLNSVLFVDRVKDTKSYVTYKEYLKLLKANREK